MTPKSCPRQEEHFLRFASGPEGAAIALAPAAPPDRARSSANRYLTIPQASRVWPLLPISSLPPSFLETWHSSICEQAYTSALDLEGSSIVPAPPTNNLPQDSPSVPKRLAMHRGKVRKTQETARILITCVVTGGAEPKEKDFSPVLTKVLKHKAELLNSPYGDLVQILGNLSGELSAVKAVIRPMELYAKTGNHSVLRDVSDNLRSANAYAEREGLTIGHEFGSVVLKATVFDRAASEDGVGAALAFLENHPFPWAASVPRPALASAFGPPRHRAAVLVPLALPAASLRRCHASVLDDLLGRHWRPLHVASHSPRGQEAPRRTP